MQRSDADRLVAQLLAMRFDPGLRVINAHVVGLPDAPVLMVVFQDAARPSQRFGAWWDFHDYEDYVHQTDEMEWLADHAKVHLEEIFLAGPPLEQRPRDSEGVAWCEMYSLDTRLPPARA